MTAHIQPVHASSLKIVKPSSARKESITDHDFSGLYSIESRENAIRNAAKKWFGPVEMLDPKARTSERARQEAILHSLFRLHRLSCNLVPEAQRLPVTEQDVFSAILVLNRISISVKCPAAAITGYCESRSVREENPRLNQLDPLQLRHLLSFHQDIPHEELNSLDIHTLRSACERNATEEIHTWFETVAKRKHALPIGAPQFLRQLMTDIWNAGNHDFIETFVTELAVLDSAMFDELGWENSRLFLAIFKRLQGSSCRPISVYIDAEEIDAAIEMYTRLADNDQVIHFRALATTFEANALRRLERTIIAASKERGTRIGITRLSPLEQKKAVAYVTSADIPTLFAAKSAQMAG